MYYFDTFPKAKVSSRKSKILYVGGSKPSSLPWVWYAMVETLVYTFIPANNVS